MANQNGAPVKEGAAALQPVTESVVASFRRTATHRVIEASAWQVRISVAYVLWWHGHASASRDERAHMVLLFRDAKW
eukprot:744336-Prorocentrum_minimum.AAC.3